MGMIDQAKAELAAVNFGAEDSAVMIDILERFFNQWDSGGAVAAAAPVLQRLLVGRPLSPLTGADEEWVHPRLRRNVRAEHAALLSVQGDQRRACLRH